MNIVNGVPNTELKFIEFYHSIMNHQIIFQAHEFPI